MGDAGVHSMARGEAMGGHAPGSGDRDGWIAEARGALRTADAGLFQVRPSRYWRDLAGSLTLAYAAATLFLFAPPLSWAQIVAYPVAVFWLYRLGSLVHEVAHLPRGTLRSFTVAWNLLVGVVVLGPAPFYARHHLDHHGRRLYGTPEDPEYVVNVWRRGSWLSLLGYVARILAYPVLVFLRFLLSPVTFVHPRLRQLVLSRASALTFNWRYRFRPTPAHRRALTALELACFVRALEMVAEVALGWAPWTRFVLVYLLALGVTGLILARQLADHHYASDGRPLDMAGHLLDSCNHVGRDPLTCLLFPFSIRYHALHHLAPTLPYHNLSAAHAHLLACLPADSPYRSLDQPSWWWVARKMFRAQARRELPMRLTG